MIKNIIQPTPIMVKYTCKNCKHSIIEFETTNPVKVPFFKPCKTCPKCGGVMENDIPSFSKLLIKILGKIF